MKANIYTSSNVDSIIEIVIDDLVNDIKITESNSLYSTILEVYENSKSTICIVKKSGYRYIIPKCNIQYIQAIEE